LKALGPVWTELCREIGQDHYSDVLLDVLGPDTMQRLVDEPGVLGLWRAVRAAELGGVEVEELLRRVATERELVSAESIANVLRYRVIRECPPPRDVSERSWAERTPAVPGAVGQFVAEVAELMDRRQDELGTQMAQEPPAWAAEHLGAVPEDLMQRLEWTRRAAVVAAFREMYSRDDRPEALGPAPSPEMPEARMAWHAAYRALGAPEAERDYAACGDAELRSLCAAHAREEAWAPAYVADLLREAEQRWARFNTSAVLQADGAAAASSTEEKARLGMRAERDRVVAEAQAQRIVKLEEVQAARAAWYAHTEASRVAAELAARELRRRAPRTDSPDTRDTAAAPGAADVAAVPVPPAPESQLLLPDMPEPAEAAPKPRPSPTPPAPAADVTPPLPMDIPASTGTAEAASAVLRTENDLDDAVTRARSAVERIARQVTEREAQQAGEQRDAVDAAPASEVADPEIGG
jgi:hypothetical protein